MHTPGPWIIKGQDIIGNATNGYICTWSGRSDNAFLIAAAPDLLEACEAALYEMKGNPSFLDSWNKLFAAVCKAKKLTLKFGESI